MAKNITETLPFSADELRRDHIRHILRITKEALEERGYNAASQLAGYLVTNDPAYISSHKNARGIIQQVERNEIIEEILRFYIEDGNKCE